MNNDTIIKLFPYANSVEFCIKDYINNNILKFKMSKIGCNWILHKNLIKPYSDLKYYYFINDKFVVTDALNEIKKPEIDLPNVSYIYNAIFSDDIRLEMKSITFSNSISKDLSPINITNNFSSVDEYIYVKYVFNKAPKDISLILCITLNGVILTVHNVIVKCYTQNILYTIQINESFNSGIYKISLLSDSMIINESDFYYNKLSTYGNNKMYSVNLKI